MRLSLHTDYALRLLMHLAVNQGRVCTIAEIARRFGISRNHLMKVANALGRAGMIVTVRGRSGGLRLGKPAETVIVGDIVRLAETDLDIVECFQAGGSCRIALACRLKTALGEAVDAFLAVLDRYTLAQLVAGNTGLNALLAEEPA